MDLVRSTLEDFQKEACRRVEARVGKPVPATGNHFMHWLTYLTNAQLIDRDEEPALQKFYNMLSQVSAHKLGSAPEQARLARKQSIEWMLLISGRVEGFLRP